MIFYFIAFIFVFLSYPLVMLFYAIPRIRETKYRFIIFLFFLLSAYLIVPYEYGDIQLYSQKLDEATKLNFSQFASSIKSIFTGTGEHGLEFFVELNLFIVSRFTNDLAYSFCITAGVVFIAWNAIVMILVREYDLNNSIQKNRTAIYLLLCFALYVIFFRAINGRFYLAYWVFIYSFYKIVAQKKFNYHLLLLCTIFIHQSFIFLNVLVVIYRFTIPYHKYKRFEYAFFALIVLGTLFSQTGFSIMNEYLGKIGGDFDKYSAYTKEDYVKGQLDRDRAWFILLRTPLLFYGLATNVLIARFDKKIVFDKSTEKIYFFSLLLWSINSFTINVPSFGDRFRNVLMGIFLLLLFKIYNINNQGKIPIRMLIVFLFFFFYKLVSLKILDLYINKWLLFPFSILLDGILGRVPIGN